MAVRSVKELDVSGKTVLVRVDFNVPLDQQRKVADDTRIVAALPTIRELTSRGARVVLMSHLGRPKGVRNAALSLAPVADRVGILLGEEICFAGDCVGESAKDVVSSLGAGRVALLENLRFHEGEEKNSVDFASKLAALGQAYVNDAFGTAHRAHASTDALPRMMKEKGAGLLMLREIDYLSRALGKPARPFVAVLGGAKISGKIDLIVNLLPRVDRLLIGGAMTFTFLKAKGVRVGRSLVEEDRVELAKELLKKAQTQGVTLELPVDCLVSDSPSEARETSVVDVDSIPEGVYGVDIGPKSVEKFAASVRGAKTVLWNGPMGVFEIEAYSGGTKGVAEAVAAATASGAISIIGGGDTAAAVARAGLVDRMSHISTGGGASLEFLAGKTLPGVAALEC